MVSLRLLVVAACVCPIACAPSPRWFGTDAGLAPEIAPPDSGRGGFVVDVARPARVAVFRLVVAATRQMTLLYADSGLVPEAMVQIGPTPAHPGRAQPASIAAATRMVRRCIESPRGSDERSRYQWGCGWVSATPDISLARPRTADGAFASYYLVLAYETPRSPDQLAAAAAAVPWSRSPATLARRLGAQVFADQPGARWAATLEPVR
jgi:hypothetical protein